MLSYRKLALAGASLISLATPAFAAEAASDESADNAPIIVEARRKDEDVQEVPQVVNAVTSQQLDKLNIREAKDITSLVPGLQLVPPPNGIGGVATMRGVNFDVNASGNNGTVEFYLNDAPMQTGVALQALFDVGQIEVLRGPQGTLRGRASPSGSITIATRRPTLDSVGVTVQGTVNDIGGVNGQVAFNIPIIKDVLAIRLAGLDERNDANRVHSLNSTENPFSRTYAGRVTALFRPVNDFEIEGSYTRMDRKAAIFSQVESANLATGGALATGSTLITPDQRLAVEDIPARIRQKYEIINVKAKWDIGPLRVNYVGNWRNTDTIAIAPNDVGNYYTSAFGGSASAVNDAFATGFATQPNFQNAAQQTDSLEHAQSHELRISSNERIFGMMDFVIGGMTYKSSPPFTLWAQTPLFLYFGGPFTVTPTTPFLAYNNALITQENSRTLERSLFGNVTLHFGDSTELSGGLRYINYQGHSEKYQTTAGRTGLTKVPLGVAVNDNFNPTIYSFSLKHKFNDNLMVYASTASSWRASAQTNGIIDRDDVYPYGTMAGLLHLAPETSKNYEIGVKSSWLDKKLTLNVTYYHQDFKNYFYSAPNIQVAQRTAIVTGTASQGSAGDTYTLATMSPALAVDVPVKVDGVEAEFGYRPNSHFSLSGSLSYSLGKIQNGMVPCNLKNADGSPITTASQLLTAAGGQQVGMCPSSARAGVDAPLSGNFQAEYNAPVGSMDAFVRTLVTFKGDAQNDPANPYDDIKAYATANLYLGIRAPNGAWEISAFGKNIFNTQRVLTRDANALTAAAQFLAYPTFSNLGGFPQPTAYRAITMTPPREFGVTAKFSLGSR